MDVYIKNKMISFLIPYTRINLKWIIDLNVKHKTVKVIELNTRENLQDLGLGEEFLDITPTEH